MRRTKTLWGGSLLLGMASLGGGCKPGPFDDLAKQAPVQAFDIEGTTMLGLRQGQNGSHATLLTAPLGTDIVLETISFDGAGHASKVRFPGAVLPDTTTYSPVVMVELPGHESAAHVVVGTPLAESASGGATLIRDVLGVMPSLNAEVLPVDPTDQRFGRGIGVSASTGDLLVSSDGVGPTAFLDGDIRTPAKRLTYKKEVGDTCVAIFDAGFALRTGNGASAGQRATVEMQGRTAAVPGIFAAGDPVAEGAGGVSFFSVDTAGVHCLGRLVPSSEPRLGQALATGDFNGDGILDLAVGAPPKTVYVHFGPMTVKDGVVSFAGKATISKGGSATFGTTLLAFTPNLKDRNQLAIGDYGADVEGKSKAGAVELYSFAPGLPLPEIATLETKVTDPSPEADAGFGQGLSLLPFCRSPNSEGPFGCEPDALAKLLVVGAPKQLFVFFNQGERLGSSGDARVP